MLLSCEIALFYPIRLRITSLLDNKTLCSYGNMSNNMSSVIATACLEPAMQGVALQCNFESIDNCSEIFV